MKTIIKLSTILLIIFSINYQGYSQITPVDGIVYVRFDGAGNGSSWENATNDLQGAIDAEGVENVYVGAGIYHPTWHWNVLDPRAKSFGLKNGVRITGSFPADGGTEMDIDIVNNPTTLSGDIGMPGNSSDNSYHVVYCPQSSGIDNTAELFSVIITDGNANVDDGDLKRGGGVFAEECNPSIFQSKIFQNNAMRGGGVYFRNCSAGLYQCNILGNAATETGGGILNSDFANTYIWDCTILNNSAVDGAGIANIDNSSPHIKLSYLRNNLASNYAGGILNFNNSNPLIESTAIESNYSNTGGGLLNSQSSPIFVNCFVSENTATTSGGGIINDNASRARYINSNIIGNNAPIAPGIANNNSEVYFTNCIIYLNGTEILNVGTGSATVTYSCVQGGYAGVGNIDVDPEMESVSYPDIRLRASSPLIEAGINDSVPSEVLYDCLGNMRIIGHRVDIGAAESIGRIYVNYLASGFNSGTTWQNAFMSLETAMSTAYEGCEIWIAAGTYKPSDTNGTGAGTDFYTFKLNPGVAIYGGFAGYETTLNQRNWAVNKVYLDGNLGAERVFHVVTAENDCNEETVLDGVTIRNGYASGAGAFRNGANIYVSGSSPIFRNLSIYSGICGNYGANIYVENSSSIFENCNITSGESDYQGGGVALFNSSAKFNYCDISDNYAYGLGGGVNVAGSGINVFSSCSFTENRADDSGSGGAFFVESSVSDLVIVNSYFAENIADASGGAIDVSGTAKIVNCTFGSNYVNDPGAMGGHIIVRASGILDVYNSVLTDGYADLGEQIHAVTGAQLSISHSMIQNCGGSGASWDTNLGVDAGGNIDFSENWYSYHDAIDDAWPGIDAGLSTIFNDIPMLQEISLDADRYPRFRGYEIDMGYLEIPYAKLTVFITPTEAADFAEWTIDNWTDSYYHGHSFWKTPETLTIEFSDVDGYVTPAPIVVDVEWGVDYDVYGVYVLSSAVIKTNQDISFSVYPNPAEDILHFDFENVNDNENLNIYSADGKLIKSLNSGSANQIDISDLSTGLYFVKYQNQTVKFIKQ